MRLVQGQVGSVMADYPAGSDECDDGSRSRSCQARVRCDDADEKDQHRGNRGGTPRLTFATLVQPVFRSIHTVPLTSTPAMDCGGYVIDRDWSCKPILLKPSECIGERH